MMRLKPVKEALKGKRILLTGATGFLGKVALEKLLRVSPDLASISLLIRSSGDQHSLERMENDIFSSPIFSVLKESGGFSSFIRSKVRFISGDTSLPRFGMQAHEYLNLLKSIDVVVNSAASVDFMGPLNHSLFANTMSVFNLVEFLKSSSHARLLHVSTCYVGENIFSTGIWPSANQPNWAVKSLPLKENSTEIDIRKIITELSNLVDQARNLDGDGASLNQRLIGEGLRIAQEYGWNNIYTFTKFLGEHVIFQELKDYRTTIVRPSIVSSCIFDPVPGWVEGLKVADPMFFGVGTGLIKFLPGDPRAVLDLVPVDIVANAMLLSLSELISDAEKKPLSVYQVCSGKVNPLLIGKIPSLMWKAFDGVPLKGRFFYPYSFFSFITKAVLMVLQAMIYIFSLVNKKQFVSKLKSKKRNLERVCALTKIYAPYISMRTVFDSREIELLHGRAVESDQERFLVSAKEFDWDWYLTKIHVPGLIRFVIPDRIKIKNSPSAAGSEKTAA